MKNIQTYIDNTLLKSDATPEMIEKLCKESIEYGFASVCVNPGWPRSCSPALPLRFAP